MSRTDGEIKAAVQEHYGARARQASSCCGDAGHRERLYAGQELGDLPETVASYGCGNPAAIAALRPGEVVLDLGSGPGLDCFLAAREVGATGRVIGLDMTPDMLALAEENKRKLGVTNVEFRRGEMESMPVEDASVDVIISNCVINLSPDKDAVFRESARVLRADGRLHVSDVVLSRALSQAERDDLALWAGCSSGALLESDYVGRLRAAGFEDVRVDSRSAVGEKAWHSATISAYKRASSAPPAGATAATVPLAASAVVSCGCGPNC
ncbi:MAG: arsenite methyltransferase [Dehalococcoidia bacterium]|nr:arsenite methyltransferase [Dehalococcoidia bacterium]